jgi:hypothetical protein
MVADTAEAVGAVFPAGVAEAVAVLAADPPAAEEHPEVGRKDKRWQNFQSLLY